MTAPNTRAKPKIALDQRAASRHDDARRSVAMIEQRERDREARVVAAKIVHLVRAEDLRLTESGNGTLPVWQ
jgi:hypothetical protein